MKKNKIYKAEDLGICGFAIQLLYRQQFPRGLTAEEIREHAKNRRWMRRVYDLVVVPDGV